jgi:hypothetical protein
VEEGRREERRGDARGRKEKMAQKLQHKMCDHVYVLVQHDMH